VWMERLKQLLAFPLYATAAWLVWVLSLQTGPHAAFAVLIAMVLISFAVWLRQASRSVDGGWRPVAGAASVIAAVAAVALAVWPRVADAPGAGHVNAGMLKRGVGVEPFSAGRLAQLRADGRVVFVNITAAWCITCQVNERMALSSERVMDVFHDRDVAYLEGDWTNRNPEITRFLEAFGREGVPLYVVYRPGRNAPVVLPQFLTEAMVLEAIGPSPIIAEDAAAEGS
jgi:thiol:disulfide interchange protein